jgi:hypothetical protein
MAATGGKPPAFPSGGSSGGGTGAGGTSSQAEEAKAFLEAVLPYVRVNSTGPGGATNWTRNADGTWTNNQTLSPGNQSIYDSSTGKLNNYTQTIDPNAKAPTLIDDAGGKYSQDLAKTIYQRMAQNFAPDIEQKRRDLQNRLAEQGFVPGNEGYIREMDRFDKMVESQLIDAASQAQIQASKQGLEEADFTNRSRTQNFTNSQDLQAQLARILTGLRTNATSGLKDLTSQASAPTGNPANTTQLAQDKYTADLNAYQSNNQSRNDLIRALMQWGLS